MDDHTLFREGLASLISSKAEFEVVGKAENGKEGVDLAKLLDPDLILMDLNMPVKDGVTATREIIAYNPESIVVVLTMSEEGEDLFAALEAGARGYLLKSTSPAELFIQLTKVLASSAPITDPMAGRILARMIHPPVPQDELSKRETEVLDLVAEGLSNREIASKLYIAENTVKKHISNIMAKLGLENRTQLARYVMKIRRA